MIGKIAGVKPTSKDLKAAVRSVASFAVRSNNAKVSGLSNEQLVEIIEGAAGKISSYNGVNERFSTPLSEIERKVYNYIRSRRSVPLAFTAFSLTKQLADFLVEEGVIAGKDYNIFLSLRCLINLFAISVMHLAHIRLGDIPGHAVLEANTSSQHPGKMVVMLNYTFPESSQTQSVVTVYASDCNACDWVDSSLLPVALGNFESIKEWGIPLEVNHEGRLAPLTGTLPLKRSTRPLP